MKKSGSRHSTIKLAGLALALALGSAAQAAEVTALRSWRAPDNTRLVLDLSAPVQYRISPDSTPAQLVLEIDDSESKVAPQLPGHAGGVKALRFETHGKQLRLLVDLAVEVNPKVFQLAPNEKYGQRLVVDLFDKTAAGPVEKVAEKPQPEVPLIAPALLPVPLEPAPLAGVVPPLATEVVKAPVPVLEKTPEKLPEKPVVVLPEKVAAEKTLTEKAVAEKPAEKVVEKTVEKPVLDKTPVAKPADKSVPRGRNIIVAIDAGHGGEDPGAIGENGTYEKNVTLAIARELEAQFKAAPGITPVLTRSGDYFIPLQERRRIARYKYKADIFISIHADSAPSRAAKGASVFALSLKGAGTASSRFARMLAERENRADLIGGVELERNDDVLRNVLADMVVAGSLEHSLHMGRNILGELDQVGKLHAEQVEQAGFAVLKEPGMVSLLVETGFISNPDEEKNLTSKKYQQQIARAVFEGARRYCQNYPVPGTYFAWLAEKNRKSEEAGRPLQLAAADTGPKADAKEPKAEAKPVTKIEPSADKPAERKSPRNEDKPRLVKHRVAPGENLTRLAARYETTLAVLRQLNDLADDDNVRIGQVLKIPAN